MDYDYKDKIIELLKQQYTYQEVAENLYLNYHSVVDTDEVYRIRKKIAQKYLCNLNDVKLIGSAHTGYANENGELIKRDDPKDYDFAIINSDVFIRMFHKISFNEIIEKNKRNYTKNILLGKLHSLYADSTFRRDTKEIIKEISDELDIDRKISICFYLSEKAFIDGLVEYNKTLYSSLLKMWSQAEENINLVANMPIKELEKMGE